MANDLSRGNVLIADTVGLLWRGQVWVKGFEYVPANAGDTFTLLQYKTATPIANTKKSIVGTITDTNKLSATGALPNIYAQFALLHIIKSSGSVNNTKNGGLFLITAAGNNNDVVTSDAAWPLTNEVSKDYDIEAFAGTVFYQALSPGTDKQSIGRWFGETGILAENLALSVLTAGSKLYLYI